ncbi:hypothetical protein A3A79_01415 [Candidatus Gottesmanbacteria bacterium RIFCSPLOWO2_01_FULL_43_11b]|uniref:Nucleotidyl transferase AbiEii/AbiGii toxin family protein n=1 Tax=Candidatus Gottesmanbacteria bacterium RIFCSPLOWO2_01_FULL_43_11b TaxID=1798392 RepID=A0A1F6AGN4_9BACT|nr:MAG: hypothetical protein A3A79_01415 [Candidatus Gottesmanbacteria bacterium RIFCSPLOWO2_01_FULL_43_11b]
MFTSVLPSHAQAALAVLGKSRFFRNAYLAGGTALALWFGHRESIDFDFFSPVVFDPVKLSQKLSSVGSFTVEFAKGISLIGEFNGVKMSYFQYDYPLLAPTTDVLGISIAHIHDIAAMKLVAICDRSTKKDFIDLYTLVHHDIPFERMFSLYEKKYRVFEANKFTIIKSLTYFEGADADTMPRMLTALSWDEVKRFFIAESMRLGKKFLEGKGD